MKLQATITKRFCPKCRIKEKSPVGIVASEIAMGDYSSFQYSCGHLWIGRHCICGAPILKNHNFHTEDCTVVPPLIPPSPENTPAENSELSETPIVPETPTLDFNSLDGSKTAYAYQREGVLKLVKNKTHLLADAMGLGKTVQALLTLRERAKLEGEDKIYPCLILVKSATLFQWTREFCEWESAAPLKCIPLLNKKYIFPLPGTHAYIMSMDTLARKGVRESVNTLGIKSIIVDECQSFKDPGSARTGALIRVIQENNIANRYFLSGTPIKNSADEYFVTLNLVNPEHFRSETQFKRMWLIQNEKGKYDRINPDRLNEFKEMTRSYILRREKREVLLDLPPFTRNYEFVEIEDEGARKAYNKELDLFSNFLNSTDPRVASGQLLGWLAKLRNLTGTAKIPNILEWVENFHADSDDLLAVGLHHTTVRDVLFYQLTARGMKPAKLSGEDNVYQKDAAVKAFMERTKNPFLINMLAGGVGLNLQACSTFLCAERCWNSSDEEQFESRFDRNGQKNPVTGTYLMAAGTLDQWMHEMVERKRAILGEALSGYSLTSDTAAMLELAQTAINNPLK